MRRLAEAIEAAIGLSPEIQYRILVTALLIPVLLALRAGAVWVLERRTANTATRYFWRKATKYAAIILGIFLIGPIWTQGFQTVATILGLIALGLTITMRDYIVNFASWFYILARRPFAVGDRIQVGETVGDVIDLGVLDFTLMEAGRGAEGDRVTGRLVHVPNGLLTALPVANFTREFPYVWHEFPVELTVNSAWEEARSILKETVERHVSPASESTRRSLERFGGRYVIHAPSAGPDVLMSVRDGKIVLTVRYLCDPRRLRESERAIWEDALRAFRSSAAIRLWAAP